MGGFDRAQFVMVPKWDEFVVHFLRPASESVGSYHDVIFDYNILSHEALYAPLVLKIVAELQPSSAFKLDEMEDPKPDERGDARETRKPDNKDEDGDLHGEQDEDR
jgi:hypothetical protein